MHGLRARPEERGDQAHQRTVYVHPAGHVDGMPRPATQALELVQYRIGKKVEADGKQNESAVQIAARIRKKPGKAGGFASPSTGDGTSSTSSTAQGVGQGKRAWQERSLNGCKQQKTSNPPQGQKILTFRELIQRKKKSRPELFASPPGVCFAFNHKDCFDTACIRPHVCVGVRWPSTPR